MVDADAVRERLWSAMETYDEEWGGSQNAPDFTPVSLSREEFTALRSDWFEPVDGPPPRIKAGAWWWRDVPFTVRRGAE